VIWDKATRFWTNIDVFKRDHKANILAVKALYNGHADEQQQKRAYFFIINYLCKIEEIGYFETDRDTSFALGRQAVGKILKGIATDSDYIKGTNL